MTAQHVAACAVFDVNSMLEASSRPMRFENAGTMFGDEYAATYFATVGDLSFVLLDTDDGEWWNVSTLDRDAHNELVREKVPSCLLTPELFSQCLTDA